MIFNIPYHWTIFWIMYSKTFFLVIGIVLCRTRTPITKLFKFISFGQCSLRRIDYSLFYVWNYYIGLCFIHSKTKLKIFESSMQFDVLFISGVVRTWFYTKIVNNVHVLWNMVAYYCNHYVKLSDLCVVLSDLLSRHVDFTK